MSETIPNPPDLAPQFEIRRLTKEHIPWATAIVIHSNVFCSPLWPVVYPENLTTRLYAAYRAADYLVRHQISSGLSYGVFDRTYKFKYPDSAPTGGKLHWDETRHTDASSAELLEQMDFPLVSVALSYDGVDHLDMAQMMPLVQQLPLFGTLYAYMAANDRRDPAVYTPTARGQILKRNATATRADYAGRGTMGALARFLMREAKKLGYRGIGIEAVHDAVAHVWLNPPAPFKGEMIVELDPETYVEVGEDGVERRPFLPSKQRSWKIWVTL